MPKPIDDVVRMKRRGMAQLTCDHGEVARCQVGHLGQTVGRRALEEASEGTCRPLPPKRPQIQLEDETPQRRRIERAGVIGCGDDRKWMPVQPREQFVHLPDFPAVMGSGSVEQQRIRLVEQQHRLVPPRLGKGFRDLCLGLADPFRQQVRRALDDQRSIERTREMMRHRGLAGAGWTGQQERHVGRVAVAHRREQRPERTVGFEQIEIEYAGSVKRQLRPAQRPDQGGRRADAAVGVVGQTRSTRRHAQHRCGLGRLVDQAGEVVTGMHALIARDPVKHPQRSPARRRAELQHEAHPPQDRIVDIADRVGGPDHRHGVGFQHPVDEHLASRAPREPVAVGSLTRLAEIARITATQAQTVAQTEADKVIQTATIARDGAIQTATIERDRTIEIARITTAVQTAQKSEEESTATAAANEARALAVRAEESVATAKATEIANRNKNVAVIAATQRAQEEAVQITVAATADKEAAEARASALRTEATAEADAEKARAEGREAAFKVDAAGQASINEATNLLSDAQTALLIRRAMLDALPAIIAAASKPMENIDRISILDARGLHGDAAGADSSGGGGQTNLADAAVAAAMRYRVGGPLIDGLMAELGMSGGSLDGMLSGTGATGVPVVSSRKPSALNGNAAPKDDVTA